MATQDLTALLDAAGVEYELMPHAHTESATDEANALGLSADEVAKTLVLTTPDGYVRAVLPASCRVDSHKLRDLFGASKDAVHLASESEMARDYPDFELGAVPPLGGTRKDRVIVDTRVADRDSIVLEAGSHEQSIRLKPAELVRVADAQVADICSD
jgi:Ala-tRNA(Pro) deacylase